MSKVLPNPLDQKNLLRSRTMNLKYYIFLIKTNTYFITITIKLLNVVLHRSTRSLILVYEVVCEY